MVNYSVVVVLDLLAEGYLAVLDCCFLYPRGAGEMRDFGGYMSLSFVVLIVTRKRVRDFQRTCWYRCRLYVVVNLFLAVLCIGYCLPERSFGFRQFGFHWKFLLLLLYNLCYLVVLVIVYLIDFG